MKENIGFVLGPEEKTLAETLQESGFVCAGFIGAYVMASEFDLAQGFDHYDESFPSSPVSDLSGTSIQRTAQEVSPLSAILLN
ncbi:MAG: hypothetical protein JSU96_06795 [Acidobacteriota bacterium]|nr:MAG: hypothetical protein JSU96_06795 [Acidobacteriota bacterium]